MFKLCGYYFEKPDFEKTAGISIYPVFSIHFKIFIVQKREDV